MYYNYVSSYSMSSLLGIKLSYVILSDLIMSYLFMAPHQIDLNIEYFLKHKY